MRKLSMRLNRPRKLTAKIAVTIAAALGIMLGISAPAYADGTPTSLQRVTHACQNIGNGVDPWQMILGAALLR
jgi:hypothetical protein